MVDQRDLNKEIEPTIKLIDFGLASYYQKGEEMNEELGTVSYMAPEVFDKKYTSACDYWSIGVITFKLLSGKLAFRGANEMEIKNKIRTCNYDIDDKDLSMIS
jgi:serine/threonine protein kinase